jgi:hypothetical protein
LVVLGKRPRRPRDAAYRAFFGLVAVHIGAAIAGDKAHEAELRHDEALAEIDRAKTAFHST